mmetsp:Transcript_17397/g.40394  ORF Transcript_17397/g.40394 Transcript_17397/m.40394 type:complete len:270 (+) Transcript_17397:297-1106(+)
MIRQGIPPVLRCAVWLSSIMKSCHPHESREYASAYRTLGKVRQMDYAWDAVRDQIFPDESDERDAVAPTFGNEHHFSSLLQHDNNHVHTRGKREYTHVLYALEHVLGLEYAPLVPTMTGLLLRYMSSSYAFSALREMAQNATWYFPVSRIEHVAWCRTFVDLLGRLHPRTARRMKHVGLDPIFCHFFLPLLPYPHVVRIMDIYTYEGCKVLFRFGIALLSLFDAKVRTYERNVYDTFFGNPNPWRVELTQNPQLPLLLLGSFSLVVGNE